MIEEVTALLRRQEAHADQRRASGIDVQRARAHAGCDGFEARARTERLRREIVRDDP
jgi:hypothetical protein